MDVLIDVRGLFYEYHTCPGGVRALQGISLTVKPGEFVTIIGPNGSGKSTLIKHFNALLAPTRGEVRVGGFSTCDQVSVGPIRRMCGMVFQNPDNQLVATTVKEDIAFGLENLGYPSPLIRKKVFEVMEMVGIADLAEKPPHLLSGGQKQKVAIAGVLVMEPRCLLLDEATSMLDPRGREEVHNLVSTINRDKNIAIVQATHFMEEAALAERVLVMQEGVIVAEGTSREILSRVADLERWKLDAPVAARMAYKLRESGVELPSDIIEIDELVNSLC